MLFFFIYFNTFEPFLLTLLLAQNPAHGINPEEKF